MSNNLYSPYGAYELKAYYQRNLLLGTFSVTIMIGMIMLSFWIVSHLKSTENAILPEPLDKVISILEIQQQPSIIQKKLVGIKPQLENKDFKLGPPIPVPDDEMMDDDVTLVTREEMADIITSKGMEITDYGESNFIFEDTGVAYYPEPEDFVAVEIMPVMIYYITPVYPRLAKQAGITGIVWIKALIDKEGNVRKALVGKSSNTTSLDEAAVEAAYGNKFKPGIQNGDPVSVWVTYKVIFELDK